MSPSGFHLTHTKALVSPHDLPLHHPDYALLKTKCLQIIQWQVDLLNPAITNHHSYNRGQMIINVMILKEPFNYKIHWLCVNYLYKHDDNLILMLKLHSLIQQYTHKNILNPRQFSGIPGRDTIQPTQIEEFQYEIS